MNNYGEIDLASIAASGKNPRKHFDKTKLEELAASIKQKGVIEPIIVRRSKVWDKAQATGAKAAVKQYELVAGERRFKAAGMAGLVLIPAIVRELTDDEAYDFMLIENIQRSDLTDREEAESFKAYAALHKGKDGIVALAEKTGISPAYIRSRIGVLELPARVLKAWEKGELVFGHLQQLLRVQDEAELKETIDRLFSWGMTVKKLATHIDEQAPALSGAFFPMKVTCAGCSSSSIVQKDLFDVDADKARCLNPSCFKKHQNDYLGGHWKETAPGKKCGTNGFLFSEGYSNRSYRSFGWSDKSGVKCKTCPEFVTVIEISGKVDYEHACAGEGSCFNAVTNPKSAKERETGERDPEAPRAGWHGEYFRDKFYRPQIEEKVGKLHFPVSDGLALLLAAAVKAKGSYAVEDSVEEILGVKPGKRGLRGCEAVIEAILQADAKTLEKLARAVVLWIVQDGQSRDSGYSGDGFGTGNRAAIGAFLGIDLAKEYAVDVDYLAKKTRAEVLAFIKKFKLFPLDNVTKMKKKDLDKAVLVLGQKLVGKVPTEILG